MLVYIYSASLYVLSSMCSCASTNSLVRVHVNESVKMKIIKTCSNSVLPMVVGYC